MVPVLTTAQARRIVLAAQGFASPKPAKATMRQFDGVARRLGLIQIDSVNVLARAQYLPVFSRLGDYDVGLFDRAGATTPPRLLESWAHAAALVPTDTWHLLRWRMRRQAHNDHWRPALERRDLVDAVLELVEDQGPMTASQVHAEIALERRPKHHWGWNWTDEKHTLEALFTAGRLVVARRNAQFERLYDLPERVLGPLPAEPDEAETQDELIRIAARALGVATPATIQDYFRMRRDDTQRAIERLVTAGELERVHVDGWGDAVLDPIARRPRKVDARALLAPFDPLIFDRERLLALFGIHYRIGIYTPAAQRTHGYYVLPFLLGDEIVARVDLKADRKASRLLVQQLTWEPDAPDHAAAELDAALREMTDWLGLDDVSPAP